MRAFSQRTPAEHNQFALIYLDLDNFKLVNDTYGHEQGDNLLLDISQQLRLQMRDKDVLSRIGGDEFVIVLPSLTKASLCQDIALRCQQAVKKVAQDYETVQPVSASFGIAMYPLHGHSAKELLAIADKQMYEMKLALKVSPLG